MRRFSRNRQDSLSHTDASKLGHILIDSLHISSKSAQPHFLWNLHKTADVIKTRRGVSSVADRPIRTESFAPFWSMTSLSNYAQVLIASPLSHRECEVLAQGEISLDLIASSWWTRIGESFGFLAGCAWSGVTLGAITMNKTNERENSRKRWEVEKILNVFHGWTSSWASCSWILFENNEWGALLIQTKGLCFVVPWLYMCFERYEWFIVSVKPWSFANIHSCPNCHTKETITNNNNRKRTAPLIILTHSCQSTTRLHSMTS